MFNSIKGLFSKKEKKASTASYSKTELMAQVYGKSYNIENKWIAYINGNRQMRVQEVTLYISKETNRPVYVERQHPEMGAIITPWMDYVGYMHVVAVASTRNLVYSVPIIVKDARGREHLIMIRDYNFRAQQTGYIHFVKISRIARDEAIDRAIEVDLNEIYGHTWHKERYADGIRVYHSTTDTSGYCKKVEKRTHTITHKNEHGLFHELCLYGHKINVYIKTCVDYATSNFSVDSNLAFA